MKPYYEDDLVTLYHARCQDVLPSIASATVDALVTDPPYGMNFRSNSRTATEKFAHIEGDGDVDTSWFPEAWRTIRDGGAAYLATRWDVFPIWVDQLRPTAECRNVIVWAKGGGGMGDLAGDYSPEHEWMMYLPKGRHNLRGKRIGNVWNIPKDPPSSYEHPTQKPVSLMSRMVEKSTDYGGVVLDPFAGSGSTLRAAKNLGRKAIGVEVDRGYCDLIVRRLRQQSFDFGGAA